MLIAFWLLILSQNLLISHRLKLASTYDSSLTTKLTKSAVYPRHDHVFIKGFFESLQPHNNTF